MYKLICLLGLFCLSSSNSYAFDYFHSGIDYWNKGEAKNPVSETPNTEPANQEKNKSPSEEKKGPSSFDWNKQLDPKNEEFFKEGSHTPPAAVMELMRNPSDKNIKNWFALVEKKNKLAKRMQERVAEYLKQNQSKFKPKEVQIANENLNSLPHLDPNVKRFRFRMYFESSCPHCKRMMTTMQELQDRGYYVELRQVDNNKEIRKALPFPVVQASKEELKSKKIDAWPVLLVGDLKKKVVYRLNGYQSTQAVLNSIRSQSN